MKLTKTETKELVLKENKMTYPYIIMDEEECVPLGVIYAVDAIEAEKMYYFLRGYSDIKAEECTFVYDCWGNRIENQARIVK